MVFFFVFSDFVICRLAKYIIFGIKSPTAKMIRLKSRRATPRGDHFVFHTQMAKAIKATPPSIYQ